MKTKLLSTVLLLFSFVNSFMGDNNLLMFYSQNTNMISFKMKIKGDSNIKLWESDVTKIEGSSEFNGSDIKSITLAIPVNGIKSGKNGMDEKIYEAMNEKKHPNINYVLKRIVSNDGSKIVLEGDLTINGETKVESTESDILVEGNTLILKGSKKIKMTDYKVEPPTAVFGTIKCKDDIDIEYEFKFSKN